MVPASSASTKTKSKKKSSSSSSATAISAKGDLSAGADSSSIEAAMQEYLKKAGVDTDQLEELVKNLGEGGGGGAGGMPGMKESLEMMNSMMDSELFQSYLNDPEKLEQSRQMILSNPMLKSMMGGMPGMEQILNDPVAWREAMQAAASMYKSMDPDTLMSMMSMGGAGASAGEGMGAGGGLPPGLFSGTLDDPSSTAAAAALDELDEDE
jgi:hypothetical protein